MLEEINFDSVKNIMMGYSNQPLIYGFSHCRTSLILYSFENQEDSWIEKAYSWIVGTSDFESTTLEGRIIEKIPTCPASKMEKDVKRRCKAGLTNVVLENVKRSEEGLKLIPIIVCVDCDINNYPANSTTITSRDPTFKKIKTLSELRRMFKLTEVDEIAKKSFVFVKVTKKEDGKLHLIEIEPFWTKQDWAEKWQQRVKSKEPTPPKEVCYQWKIQFMSKKNKFLKSYR